MVTLSDRLQKIADMVCTSGPYGDIGTDHGYLPIFLAQQNKIKKALACDVNKGPLEGAANHIRECGFSAQIETRLSNGFEKIEPGEIKSATISGMGGNLIVSILEKGMAVVRELDELIISPQSDIAKTRQFLIDNELYIDDEDCLFDEGKFYQIIHIGREKNSVYKEAENLGLDRELCLEYGPILLGRRHPAMMEFLSKKITKLQSVIDAMEETLPRAIELREEIEKLRSIVQ